MDSQWSRLPHRRQPWARQPTCSLLRFLSNRPRPIRCQLPLLQVPTAKQSFRGGCVGDFNNDGEARYRRRCRWMGNRCCWRTAAKADSRGSVSTCCGTESNRDALGAKSGNPGLRKETIRDVCTMEAATFPATIRAFISGSGVAGRLMNSPLSGRTARFKRRRTWR